MSSSCELCSHTIEKLPPNDLKFHLLRYESTSNIQQPIISRYNVVTTVCQNCYDKYRKLITHCFSCNIDFKRIPYVLPETYFNKWCLNPKCQDAIVHQKNTSYYKNTLESKKNSITYYTTLVRKQCRICVHLASESISCGLTPSGIGICKNCLTETIDQTSREKLVLSYCSIPRPEIIFPVFVNTPRDLFFKTESILEILRNVHCIIDYNYLKKTWFVKNGIYKKPMLIRSYEIVMDLVDKQNNNSLYPDNYKIILELGKQIEENLKEYQARNANNNTTQPTKPKLSLNNLDTINLPIEPSSKTEAFYSEEESSGYNTPIEEKSENFNNGVDIFQKIIDKNWCLECLSHDLCKNTMKKDVECTYKFCQTFVCQYHAAFRLQHKARDNQVMEPYCSESCLKNEILESFETVEDLSDYDDQNELWEILDVTLYKRTYQWKIFSGQFETYCSDDRKN